MSSPRPRKPGKNASASQWQAYWNQMQLWQNERDCERQARQSQRRPRFEKYTSSESRDTGRPQTDLLFGEAGTKGGHIAVDDEGRLRHVRDEDGTVIYDPDNGIESPQPGWD